jgi:H+-transporting ATPase
MTIAIMVFVVLASIYYHFFPLTAIMLIALALLDDVPIMTNRLRQRDRAAAAC